MECSPKGIMEERHSQNKVNLANNVVLSSSNKTTTSTEEKGSLQKDLNLTFKIYKDFKICIYKPLIPLKLTLFFMFGAGTPLATFLAIFLKQRGVTLVEFSTLNVIVPVVESLGPTISGVVADKLGRSKPVLVVNLLLTLIFVIGILLVPRMDNQSSGPDKLNLECHYEYNWLIARAGCNRDTGFLKLERCNISYPENATWYCNEKNLICELLARNEDFKNFSLSIYIDGSFEGQNQCYYNVSFIVHNNVSYSWCNFPLKRFSLIECASISNSNSTVESGSRTKHVITLIVILILFYTTFTNCYRIMDATSMSLVKEHNSDFGHQRFFSILGVLVWSPIVGAVVQATTAKGEEKNYASVFYLFIGLWSLSIAIISKLDVRLNPPGKKMTKNSFKLMKNPDNILFFVYVFVLGTAWNFKKYFTLWYLEDLNAPSLLLGLIPTMSSLYGLPFLLTSNWWVKKIGPTQIFLLGLLGYAICGAVYSFLISPWFSLILEATDIITYHLLWVAVITHCHSIAPEGLTATIIATAGAVHFCIGKTSGSLIGGLIMNSFGGRKAYRVMAIICSASATFYGLYLYVRRSCYTKQFNTSEKHDVAENAPTDFEGSIAIYSLKNI